MGHCQVLPPLCPLQAETVAVDILQGLPSGSIGMVTTGQEPVVDGFPASLHPIQIPHLRHQGLSTYEVILLDHPQQNMDLTRCGHPRSPHGLAWHLSCSGSMPSEDTVGGTMTHTTSNSTFLHVLMAKCKHFMPNIPTWVERDIITTISENLEKKNMQLLIRTCHSAKADLGKWPHKLRFWTSAIPLGIGVKVRQR